MIGAILVLYNPNIDILSKALKSLTSQVNEICIVDNSENSNEKLLENFTNIHYIPLYKNIGIAAAQNIAIKYFQEQHYDFVLFSDQDSIAQDNLVNELYISYNILKNYIDIAAIGPLPINRESNKPYIYEKCIIDILRKELNPLSTDAYIMHSIISSFSLIPLKNFQIVGGMREELFIDFVDQEWCWRAAFYHNLKSVLLSNLSISHALGEGDKIFLKKRIKISSSFRIYFQYRNFLWLKNKEFVPRYWIKMNTKKFIFKTLYYPLFVSPRYKYLKRIFSGIYDGIKYRSTI